MIQYAAIDIALVQVWGSFSPDTKGKIDIIETLPESETLSSFKMALPILSFPEDLIRQDGFISTKLLRYIHEQHGEHWFIFGSFRNQNGKRCYVVLRADSVPEKFAIQEWEILEWTEKRIHQI